jgi:hypothetical protein
MKIRFMVTLLCCSVAFTQAQQQQTNSICDTTTIVLKFPYGKLTQAEQDSLIQMVHWEKFFEQVYNQFHQQWQHEVFKNVPQNEAKHSKALEALLTKYKLTLANTDNASLTQLQEDWITQGNTSLVAALTVSAIMEDKYLVELQNALSNKAVDNFDIQFVYQNLAKGSRNHLRTLISVLKEQRVEYQAHYLTPANFQEIIHSPHERYAYEETGDSTCGLAKKNQSNNQTERMKNSEKWVEQMQQQQQSQKFQPQYEEKIKMNEGMKRPEESEEDDD